ncbi:MAG: BadF/BadG/BcrA/BcrD ATPase family protein, partial [Pseudomonadota bacterium]
MSESLFLGVDGGGTRCRARIETADGTVLGSGRSGPATMRLGVDAASLSVMAAVRQAMKEAKLGDDRLKDIHAGVGLAGMGQYGARTMLDTWQHPFASAVFEGDGYLACLGAFNGDDGGIVIIGTGSIGCAVWKGENIRIGGYGFPVADEGSGADLGLNAIRYALRAYDGREPQTPLSQAVLARFSNDPAVVMNFSQKIELIF